MNIKDRQELIHRWLNEPAQQQENHGASSAKAETAVATTPTRNLMGWWKEQLKAWMRYWTPYWLFAAMFLGTGYFGGVFMGYVMGGMVITASAFALFLRVPHYLFLRWQPTARKRESSRVPARTSPIQSR